MTTRLDSNAGHMGRSLHGVFRNSFINQNLDLVRDVYHYQLLYDNVIYNLQKYTNLYDESSYLDLKRDFTSSEYRNIISTNKKENYYNSFFDELVDFSCNSETFTKYRSNMYSIVTGLNQAINQYDQLEACKLLIKLYIVIYIMTGPSIFARASNRARVKDAEDLLNTLEQRLQIQEARAMIPGPAGEAFKVDAYGVLDTAKIEEIQSQNFRDDKGLPLSSLNFYYFVVSVDVPASRVPLLGLESAESKEDRSRHSLVFDGSSWADMGPFTGVQGAPGTPFDPAEVQRLDGLIAGQGTRVVALESSVIAAVGRLDGVDTELARQKTIDDGLRVDVDSARAVADGAKTKADANEAVVAGHAPRITANENEIVAVKADAVTLTTRVLNEENKLIGHIAYQSQYDSNKTTWITGIEVKANKAETDIQWLTQQSSDTNGEVLKNKNAVAVAQSAANSAGNVAAENTGQIQVLAGRASAVEYDVGVLKTKRDGQDAVNAETLASFGVQTGVSSLLRTDLTAVQTKQAEHVSKLAEHTTQISDIVADNVVQGGQITSLVARDLELYDEVINLWKRSTSMIIVEGEVHSNNQVYFSSGSSAWIEGRFGIRFPRAGQIVFGSGVSSDWPNADDSKPCQFIDIPIIMYHPEGSTPASTTKMLTLYQKDHRLVGTSTISLSIAEGSVLSIGQPIMGGVLHLDTRLRLTLEYKGMDDTFAFASLPEPLLTSPYMLHELTKITLYGVIELSNGILKYTPAENGPVAVKITNTYDTYFEFPTLTTSETSFQFEIAGLGVMNQAFNSLPHQLTLQATGLWRTIKSVFYFGSYSFSPSRTYRMREFAKMIVANEPLLQPTIYLAGTGGGLPPP